MSATPRQPDYSALPTPPERRAAEQLALDQAFFEACEQSDFERLVPLIGRANPFWLSREGVLGIQPHAFSLAFWRENYPLLHLLLQEPRVHEWLREPEQSHLLADCVHQEAPGLVRLLLPFFRDERIESTCSREWSRSLHDLGATPLMIAADTADAAIIGLLLEAGASPTRQNTAGQTALMHLGTANADAQTLRACFARLLPVSDPSQRDIEGRTALIASAEFGNLVAVQALLPVSDLLAKNMHKTDAWWSAIVRERFEIVDFLAAFVPVSLANAAFLNFGAGKMPQWAARLEARALSETVAQVARELQAKTARSPEAPKAATPESAPPSTSSLIADTPSRPPARL